MEGVQKQVAANRVDPHVARGARHGRVVVELGRRVGRAHILPAHGARGAVVIVGRRASCVPADVECRPIRTHRRPGEVVRRAVGDDVERPDDVAGGRVDLVERVARGSPSANVEAYTVAVSKMKISTVTDLV